MDSKLERAKNIDLVEYLSSQGFHSVKTKGDVVYYNSPFRTETSPSFEVSLSRNKWIDFGRDQKRKDIIDFVEEMEGCSTPEAIDKLLDGECLVKHEYDGPIPTSRGIDVISQLSSINNYALIEYMEEVRKIPIEIVNRYCSQVCFQFPNRRYVSYFGVGMLNDAGGWSIRGLWFKGATRPASVTTVKKIAGATQVSVFEGLVDWLSYVLLYGEPDHDVIVLHSLVYIPLLIDKLKTYSIVNAWLDNDAAAEDKMELMISESIPIMDHRDKYRNYPDLNDYLVATINKEG